MWEDPIVGEVRRVRDELAARFNYDVKAIFADMRARRAARGSRLVNRSKQFESVEAASENQPSEPRPLNKASARLGE